MDNNPFRSQQTPPTGNNHGYMTPNQQQPYYNSNLGYSQPQNGYQPQPQQQSWQYLQQQQQLQNTGVNPQPNTYPTLPQSNYNPTTTTTAALPPSQYSPYNNNSLMPSTNSSMSNFGGGNTYPPFGVQQNTALPNNSNDSMYNTNLMGYQQQQSQYQPPQQQYNPSNFYIPPDFGASSNNNSMFQPQQPKHAPVDASTLLKGTEVRRIECPVCQKMIEGDDMAVNHHVNEHYS